MTPSAREAKQYAVEAAEHVTEKQWVGQLARLGYFAIGTVYVLVGLLAVLALAGVGGQLTGSGGAARTLLHQPFGRFLLSIVAVGLVVYVCWRFAQSVLDVESRGTEAEGLLRRFGLALSGFSYAGLAGATVRHLVTGNGQVQDTKDDWTATLLAEPAGAVLVGLLGLAVIGTGLVQFYKAYHAPFVDTLDTSRMTDRARRWVTRIGRFGLTARGFVFLVIGFFLIVAAWQFDPSEARGLGGTLRTLARQPYGTVLIGLVAFGLVAFGVHVLTKAGYRHISEGLSSDSSS